MGWRCLWNACQLMSTFFWIASWLDQEWPSSQKVSQFTGWPLALEFELTEVGLLLMVPIILLALPLFNSGYSTFSWYFWGITASISKCYSFSSVGTQDYHLSQPPCSWIGALWLGIGQWSVGWRLHKPFLGLPWNTLCRPPCSVLPCLGDCGGCELRWRNKNHESWHGGELLWRIALMRF